MITIECPLCDEMATADAALTVVSCDGCGVAVEVTPGPAVRALDVAA